jgi:hypothetical protein
MPTKEQKMNEDSVPKTVYRNIGFVTSSWVNEMTSREIFEESLPEAIWQAYYETYATQLEVVDIQEIIEVFVERWGSLEVDAFIQALQQGDLPERLFALLALAYLAPPAVETLLTPFLHSVERKERWASTIALGIVQGNRKDEQLLLALQELLLLEEMDYQGDYESKLARMVYQAAEEAGERFGSRSDLDKLLDPAVMEAYYREGANQQDYEWFMARRYVIVWLFEDWRDPKVLPTLHQVLRRCQELQERHPVGPVAVLHSWAVYKKHLTNAIGLYWKPEEGKDVL